MASHRVHRLPPHTSISPCACQERRGSHLSPISILRLIWWLVLKTHVPVPLPLTSVLWQRRDGTVVKSTGCPAQPCRLASCTPLRASVCSCGTPRWSQAHLIRAWGSQQAQSCMSTVRVTLLTPGDTQNRVTTSPTLKPCRYLETALLSSPISSDTPVDMVQHWPSMSLIL